MEKEFVEKYKLLEKEVFKYEKDEDIFKVFSSEKEISDGARDIILHAIESGSYNMVYQPHIENRECVGAEALFRLNVDGVFFNPFVVFSLASFYGFEDKLTLQALGRVCSQIKDFKDKISDDFMVTYNVNPKLFNKDFCNKILGTITSYGINPSNIGIELTEVSSLEQIKKEDMLYLKNKGMTILCDDFGTGYTNAEILDLPFDVIKLAGKVVCGVDKSEEKKQSLILLCEDLKKLNKKILAENVETEEELAILDEIGVDEYQGYYFDKGISAEALTEKYSKEKTSNKLKEEVLSKYRSKKEKAIDLEK